MNLVIEDLITKGNILELLANPVDIDIRHKDAQRLLIKIAKDFLQGVKPPKLPVELNYEVAIATLDQFRDANVIGEQCQQLADVNVDDLGTSAILPDLVLAVQGLTNYCESRRPSTDVDPLFGDENMLPTPLEQDRFLRVYNAAVNPITVCLRVLDGSLMYEEIEVLNNLYPRLLKVFCAIILDILIDGQLGGKRRYLTYVQQKTLSKLTGKDISKVNSAGFRKIIQDGYASMQKEDAEKQAGNKTGSLKAPSKRMETGVNRIERGDFHA